MAVKSAAIIIALRKSSGGRTMDRDDGRLRGSAGGLSSATSAMSCAEEREVQLTGGARERPPGTRQYTAARPVGGSSFGGARVTRAGGRSGRERKGASRISFRW